jgi:hypothetical protein
MLAPQDTTSQRSCPEPFRWTRSQTAQHLEDFRDPHEATPSQRAFAQQAGLPRSTLQYWQARHERVAAEPVLTTFFESAVGLALLKRLVLAAHLVFHQAGPAGIRPLLAFFEHAGLAPFLGCSYGTHQALAQRLQELILCYGSEERQRLAPTMPARSVTLCEDENFHQDRPCLVAIEPVSNFILVETYQEHRDADTWNRVVAQATTGLPVTVVQVTSDEARGLLAHAKDGLGAQHSPDLMHVQQELHRATGLPLSRQTQQAQAELQEYQQCEQRHRQAQQAHAQGPPRPGRPPDFAGRIDLAQAFQQGAQKRLEVCAARQEQVTAAIRGLADDYHPFDQDSGQPVAADQLRQRLEGRFAVVTQQAEQAQLPQSSSPKIHKARRVLPAMVATLAWFWVQVQTLGRDLALSPVEYDWFCQRVLPAAYWEQAAPRGRDAGEKQRLRQLAQRCHAAAWSEAARPGRLGAAAAAAIREAARACVGRWVRSSSCVEGRNGLLALYHHGRHGLSEQRLQALTVLHNYWVTRDDGSTAAQRFFGQRPRDMFAWLLERFPDPPRPAQRRPKVPPKPQGGPERWPNG